VFTSAELIEALRRRARLTLRPESPPGEFPPGWRAWFASMQERLGAITGAAADAMVAVFAQRPLRTAPRRVPALSGPEAFAALWRQQWLPASRDERAQRIVAAAIALFAQLLFSILLLWLAYARYGGEPPARAGEEVVQVEFIGEGTPREEGGGAPAGAAATPAAAASARPASASAAVARAAPAASPAKAAPEQPAPQGEAPSPPAPPAAQQAQAVQVTESTAPDAEFTLPPPSPRAVVLPQVQVRVPQLTQAPETLQAVEIPSPQVKALTPELPGAHVEVPALGASVEALPSPSPPLQGIAEREPGLPAATVRVPALGASPEALPAPGPPLEGAVERSVSLPQAKVGVPGLRAQVEALPGNLGAGAEPSQSGGTAAVTGGQQQASAGGADTAVPGAGAGPKPGEKPGAWNTAKAGDDWGVSDRNRPGGQAGASGLFDENGRPRLPPGSSVSAGGGLPPGVVSEDIADLDRAGTWLKRKNPLPYEATKFDRYWLPGGTLLEEWVRRGIREVQISIPGTSKKLRCVVSLLQLGGGCGIDDPDRQDQEATARKPPDVPWKPELQEK
jgi:hypothetical protein